jgi:hypothetical protein
LTIALIGVLGFLILGGYSIRLLQNVRDGQEYPLPEWDDWGGDFMRGLKYVVVGIVWALPLIIFSIPLAIGGAITDGNGAAQFFGVSILICAGCLMFLYGLFVALAAPGFTIAYSTDERINSGLQFTEIYQWTMANVGQVVVAVLVVLLAQAVLGMLGAVLIVCLVGPALASLATSIFQHHVYGQLAREYPFGGYGSLATMPPVEPTNDSNAIVEVDESVEPVEAANDDESRT